VNEVDVMKDIDFEYIVSYVTSYITKNTVTIVMEYCENGDLANCIEDLKNEDNLLKESLIWKYFI
jgi:serine/threonine protein kinase